MGTSPLAANAQTYGIPEGVNLTGNSAVKWETNIIPVCWENLDSSNQDGRDWSRSAVEDTWQKNSQLLFTGWNQCKSDSQGIRIRIADETARSIVGKGMSGKENGMYLNFTFENWSPGCSKKREACIKAYAVHEFGHAFGFGHEQTRKDTPQECKSLHPVDEEHIVGEAQYVTSYDPNSVMSYCSGGSKAGVHNDGILTSYDTEGVQEWYGEPPIAGVPKLMIQTEGYPVVAVFSERKESFALGCIEIRNTWEKIPVNVVDSATYNSVQATNPVVADLPCDGSIKAYAPTNEPGSLVIKHRNGVYYRHYINPLDLIGAVKAGDLIPIDVSEFRTTFPERGTDFQVYR